MSDPSHPSEKNTKIDGTQQQPNNKTNISISTQPILPDQTSIISTVNLSPKAQTPSRSDAPSENSDADVKDIIVNSLYVTNEPFFDKPNDIRPHMKVTINSRPQTVLVDTGAMECVIGVTNVLQLDTFKAKLLPSKFTVTTLHTTRKPAVGEVKMSFTVGIRTVELTVVVVETMKPQLLVGMTFCNAFGIKLTIDKNCFPADATAEQDIRAIEAPKVEIEMLNAREKWNPPKPTKEADSDVESQSPAASHAPSSGLPSPVTTGEVLGHAMDQITFALHEMKRVLSQTSRPEPQIACDMTETTITSSALEGGTQHIEIEAVEARYEPNDIITTSVCNELQTAVREYVTMRARLQLISQCVKYTECAPILTRMQREQQEGNRLIDANELSDTDSNDTSEHDMATMYVVDTQSAPIAEIMEFMLQPTIREPRTAQPGKQRRRRLRNELKAMQTEMHSEGAVEMPTIRTAEDAKDTFNDVQPEKIPCVSQPHKLSPEQQEILTATINNFPYTPKTGPLNKTPIYVQRINTENAVPEMRKQYPLSPYVMEEVEKEIINLIERDIIEPIESSPWRWPILWVKKKTGGGRICLDARGLNALTVPDAYPTLNVDAIFRNLPPAKYISCLDMTQAFHQIEIVEEDRQKTAFAVGSKFYCYKRAVMGFRNSPADLAKMLDKVFKDLEPRVYHYVDDFVILSETFEEHIDLLKEIATRLRKNNLTISREKSDFCHKQITFLGYLLTDEGLTIDPNRIQPILNYKRPENVKQLRRLVGLITWYRRFIPNAAELMKPLTDLIQKENHRKIKSTDETEMAFTKLKECLTNAPILVPANFKLPFKVYTDASLVAGAAILTQIQDGHERVISYHSVKFNRTQQNYSATERECLAVLSAVEKFRPWIDGVQFTVVTDHSSLRWLQNLKEPHGKLARWAVRLQAFDIKFEHRPGKEMDAPDALSRATDMVVINKEVTTDDKWYRKTRKVAKDGRLDRYKYENGYLYRRGKYDTRTGDRLWTIVIPRELVPEVLKEKHDQSSHMGYWKTLKAIKNTYYWQNMSKDIYQYVTKCEICRTCKQTNEQTRVEGGEYRDPCQPGRMFSIDVIGPLPPSKKKRHRFAVVCIDVFSRYVFARSQKLQPKIFVISLKKMSFTIFTHPKN